VRDRIEKKLAPRSRRGEKGLLEVAQRRKTRRSNYFLKKYKKESIHDLFVSHEPKKENTDLWGETCLSHTGRERGRVLMAVLPRRGKNHDDLIKLTIERERVVA